MRALLPPATLAGHTRKPGIFETRRDRAFAETQELGRNAPHPAQALDEDLLELSFVHILARRSKPVRGTVQHSKWTFLGAICRVVSLSTSGITFVQPF
jgi:hypothetical protein